MHTDSQSGAQVLFIEDDVSVREGVSSALEAFGYRVHALPDGTTLASTLEQIQPDLALLDVTLPDGPDGFELAEYIRAHADIPLFFLTAADALEDRVRGFDIGADDYLVKPFSTRELVVRIRAVLRRASPGPRDVLTVRDLRIDVGAREAVRAGYEIQLTPTEFDLVTTLARQPGRSWSKRDLVREVWGMDEHAPHLVEVHISAIRRKLEVHGARMIVTGRDGDYSMPR